MPCDGKESLLFLSPRMRRGVNFDGGTSVA